MRMWPCASTANIVHVRRYSTIGAAVLHHKSLCETPHARSKPGDVECAHLGGCDVRGGSLAWLVAAMRRPSVEQLTPDKALDASAAPAVDGQTPRPKSFSEKLHQLLFAPRDLFLIFSIKFAESTAYYAFSYIYAAYLSAEFGMSDVEAGMLYGLYGVLCSVFGLLAGPMIDALDLRTSLLIGTVPSFIARLGSALTFSTSFAWFCSITVLPIGAAFGLPVFALGVRRFTHPENRAFAFTVFYAVLCASSAAGGMVITFARSRFHEGIDLPWPCHVFQEECHLSWMRVNVLICSGFTLYTVAASLTVRNQRVQQDVPLELARLEDFAKQRASLRRFVSVVYGSLGFWRLLAISLIVAVGTRATFRHLDATFPKYFMRTFGEDAPFEVFVAVEPVLTVLLSFPVTFLLLRHRVSTFACLVGGTVLQSFCPLALTYTSYEATLLFVCIMALGEAVWSPRLYEYSTMVAPEGFEGTFVAVAFVPQYVSAGVVGITSGVLLDTYVPETLEPGEVRRPEILWGLIALASFSTPIALCCLKGQLFGDEPSLHADVQTTAAHASPVRRAGEARRGKYAMAAMDSTMDSAMDVEMIAAAEEVAAEESAAEADAAGRAEAAADEEVEEDEEDASSRAPLHPGASDESAAPNGVGLAANGGAVATGLPRAAASRDDEDLVAI